MNYAIIGLGFIYPRHKKSIEETGGKVLLTCDIDPEKKADFEDWVKMIDDPKFKEVDAVVICTPNYLHSKMAREILLRGKRVICEKPLSINGVVGLDDVNTVLQLRYAPEVLKAKELINPTSMVRVVARMFRDEKYWSSWKGDENKSGGLLYNLGIHYLDLLIFLLGNDDHILETEITSTHATGTIRFGASKTGFFDIQILPTKENQERFVEILNDDGMQIINISNKDNLSYEDLHLEVYKHFNKGEGIPLSEAKKSLELVERLLKHGNDKH